MLLLLACTGDPAPADDSSDTAPSAECSGCFCNDATITVGGTIELEDGRDVYAEAADGTPATMVHGPQGGWHMLASARMHHTDDIVEIHYWITDVASGVEVSRNKYYVLMVKDEECSGYYPGMYGYLDVTDLANGDADTPPELLAFHELRIDMTVADQSGRTAADTLSVIAALDPMDEPDTGE